MELAFLARTTRNTISPSWNSFASIIRSCEGVFLIQDGGSSHIAGPTQEVLCQESRLVEASVYASQRLVVESSGNPHPCVQALLPETGLLEEPGGVQDPCDGFMARIQSSLCPPR